QRRGPEHATEGPEGLTDQRLALRRRRDVARRTVLRLDRAARPRERVVEEGAPGRRQRATEQEEREPARVAAERAVDGEMIDEIPHEARRVVREGWKVRRLSRAVDDERIAVLLEPVHDHGVAARLLLHRP